MLARLKAIQKKAEIKCGTGFCRFHAKPVKKIANPAKTAYCIIGSIIFPIIITGMYDLKFFKKIRKEAEVQKLNRQAAPLQLRPTAFQFSVLLRCGK